MSSKRPIITTDVTRSAGMSSDLENAIGRSIAIMDYLRARAMSQLRFARTLCDLDPTRLTGEKPAIKKAEKITN